MIGGTAIPKPMHICTAMRSNRRQRTGRDEALAPTVMP